MGIFQFVEVDSRATRKEFLLFPVELYKYEPNWIRPLDSDIESIFDPKKNKRFRNGETIRWILKNESGETIGRVAAFVDYQTAKTAILSFEQGLKDVSAFRDK